MKIKYYTVFTLGLFAAGAFWAINTNQKNIFGNISFNESPQDHHLSQMVTAKVSKKKLWTFTIHGVWSYR